MKKGLLLLNLGSPEAPTEAAVKRYLREFLMDRYVIDLPLPLRFALVYGLIAPFRSAKSAHAYASIWTDKGSPLMHFTETFATKVKSALAKEWDVRWGMRYGEPAMKTVLRDWPVESLYIVPLYPQYAESSSRTGVEAALKHLPRETRGHEIFVLQDFHQEPEYLDAQAEQIKNSLKQFTPDLVLLSFHGLPEHHLTKLHSNHCLQDQSCCELVNRKNDLCYRAQAMATASGLRQRLPLAPEKVRVGFQSRLGRRPWIKPYSDIMVSEWAAQGVKKILVSCPSFVADCLETLEEVEIRLCQQFINEGGEELKLVPALNAEDLWVKKFCQMVERPNLRWHSSSRAHESHFQGL